MKTLAVSDAVAELLSSEGIREPCAGVDPSLAWGGLPPADPKSLAAALDEAARGSAARHKLPRGLRFPETGREE